MFAVLVTGPPGSGKTTVLTALQNEVADEGVRHAAVEVEALAWAHPPLDEKAELYRVASLRQMYEDDGYNVILCSATVTSDAYMAGLLRALAADQRLIVRLQAEPATLRGRIVEREPPEWSGLPALLEAATRLSATLDTLSDVDLVLSTERLTPREIAAQICAARPDMLSRFANPSLGGVSDTNSKTP